MRQFLYSAKGLLRNILRNDERSYPIKLFHTNFIQSRGYKNPKINPKVYGSISGISMSSSPPLSSLSSSLSSSSLPPPPPSNTARPSFDVHVPLEEIPSSQKIDASKSDEQQQQINSKQYLLQQDAITRELWSQSVDYKNRILFTRPKEVYDFIIVGAGSAGCVLAKELIYSLPNINILVLEAGPSHAQANDRIGPTYTHASVSIFYDFISFHLNLRIYFIFFFKKKKKLDLENVRD